MEGKLEGRRRSVQRVLPAMVLAVVSELFAGSSSVTAGSPKVSFDVGQVVECRDVTPEGFSKTNPTEKVIEARFRVSVLVTQGRAEDIEEVMITLVSPKRRLRVIDFSPKTRLATNVVGEVETIESTEVEKSLTASVGGRVAAEYGVGRVEVSPSAGAGNVKRNLSKETFRRLPPKTSVLISGTTYRAYGVFFKLKPFEQESIEGLKEFTCRWVVPASWRGDWARVTCQARGYSRNLFYASLKQCGFVEVPIGLYLQGDATAKRMATRLSRGAEYWRPTTVSSTKTAHPGSPASAAAYARIASRSPHMTFKPVVPAGIFGVASWKLPALERRTGDHRDAGHALHDDLPMAGENTDVEPRMNGRLRQTLDALGRLSGRGLNAAGQPGNPYRL